MISPEQFKQAWQEVNEDRVLVAYTYEEMADTALQKSTKDFLAQAGLPEKTSHYYMNFDNKSYQSHLGSLKDFSGLEQDYFIQYYLIGHLEHGFICINAKNLDKVVVIDIDYPADIDYGTSRIYREEQPPEQLMNSSIAQLAECLLIYERFWHSEEISPATTEQMRSAMRTVDPPCQEPYTFWWYETQDENLLRHP